MSCPACDAATAAEILGDRAPARRAFVAGFITGTIRTAITPGGGPAVLARFCDRCAADLDAEAAFALREAS